MSDSTAFFFFILSHNKSTTYNYCLLLFLLNKFPKTNLHFQCSTPRLLICCRLHFSLSAQNLIQYSFSFRTSRTLLTTLFASPSARAATQYFEFVCIQVYFLFQWNIKQSGTVCTEAEQNVKHDNLQGCE